MTQLLEEAFTEAAKLSDLEQNVFAKWVIKELESEVKWDKAFAESEDLLDKLAGEALAEHSSGKTKLLDSENL